MQRLFSISLGVLLSMSTLQAQRLQIFGLEGMTVTSLASSPADAEYGLLNGTFLIADTDILGVFLRDLSQPDSDWVSLGLRGKRITSVYVYHWGVGPGEFNTPFAGVEPDRAGGDSTLLYQYTPEGKWVSSDRGINRRGVESITAIGGIFFHGHQAPQPLFAGGDGRIYRSWNIGGGWEEVFTLWASLDVLKVHQASGEVWAGGGWAGYSFLPWIAKSTDRGSTWEEMYLDVCPNNSVLSLSIHPEHPDTVYAGIRGAVVKTTDGGKIWEFTELRNTSVYFYGLAIDPGNPEHLWAGGSLQGLWRMWESFDSGKQWKSIDPEVMIEVPGISSLVPDPHRPGAVYIGTFGAGVWRYESPKQTLACYFPMQIGNRWRFSFSEIFSESYSDSMNETIVDTIRVADSLYFVFDYFRHFPNISFRMTCDSKLLVQDNSREQVWLDFYTAVGDSWHVMAPDVGSEWTVFMQSKTDTVSVPAGTFTNCYRFRFQWEGVDNDWEEWYAPGVGPVRRIYYGAIVYDYQLTSAFVNGVEYPTQVITPEKGDTPAGFHLYANYPNPFNASTTIRYDLPKESFVTLAIFDLLGRKVRTLVSNTIPAGPHTLQWDGNDDAGKVLGSGVYYCRLRAGEFVDGMRMVLLR